MEDHSVRQHRLERPVDNDTVKMDPGIARSDDASTTLSARLQHIELTRYCAV
jgi:hypothetical protein